MMVTNWVPIVANHLWQSTLVGGVGWLLAVALRRNRARMRYRVWLIASLKFLVPFSFLIAVGENLSLVSSHPSLTTHVPAVIEEVAQPFAAQDSATALAPEPNYYKPGLLSIVLLATWVSGFCAVLFTRWCRWRYIRSAVDTASPLNVGADVPVLSSPVLIEPAVFGVFRPMLLLPEGIADQLSPAHVKAVIVHELCHIRRRDNLTAGIHMLVEAVFWFHPLVWWIGSRLVEERECACDEEVLDLGSEPAVYAESILKTCQFYLESPLECASGMTGSDLKKRIVRIMTQRLGDRLSFGRRLLLVCSGIGIIAAPVLFGFANASQSTMEAPSRASSLPSFEFASLKPSRSHERGIQLTLLPGRFTATNVTLKELIEYAYNIREFQILGGPSWIDSQRYDVEANTGLPPAETRKRYLEDAPETLRLMLQSLLEERFRLILSKQTKEAPMYALAIANNGPKLRPTWSQRQGSQGPPKRLLRVYRGQIMMAAAPVRSLADALSSQLGRLVVDETRLMGLYDATLKWAPDEAQTMRDQAERADRRSAGEAASASRSSIVAALQEQLGLKLLSAKGRVEILAIDHAEKASEN